MNLHQENQSKGHSDFSKLSKNVLIGAILGILFGLFFGEYNKIFAPLGAAYTMLLQAVVYPYLICTILSGLGRLTWKTDSKLLVEGIKIYFFLVVLVFCTIFILSSGLPALNEPPGASGSFSENLINIIVPNNIFSALVNNYVPAIVIFFVIFGLVLQKVENKNTLINILDVISNTCLGFWKWLVSLAPYAVFFILAETAGTISLYQLIELSNYLALFFIGTLLLTFWLLPVILAAITNETYSSIWNKLKPALLITVATTLSVSALPYIRELALASLKERLQSQKRDENNIVNTTVSLSYPFGQLGNVFISLFMLFTALYFNHPITQQQKIMLPFISYISSLGSPSTVVNTVSFLSKWLNLTGDSTALYFGIMPIVRYGQVLVSVMCIAFLTISITYKFFGLIKINYKKIIFHIISFFVILFLVVKINHLLIEDPSVKMYRRLNTTTLSSDISSGMKAVIYKQPVQPVSDSLKNEDALFSVQKRGILRVGYNADMKPFVFFNQYNELVGYDVEMVYALAKSLKVQLVFIPFQWTSLLDDIKNKNFDIAIGGIYVTPDRLQEIHFTDPVFQGSLSFIARENEASQFSSSKKINAIENLRIGVMQDPILMKIILKNFPNAKIVILPNYQSETIEKAFANNDVDTIIWSSAQTNIWALGHPNFTSVIPKQVVDPFMMAYMINKDSDEFVRYINYWLRLETVNNLQQYLNYKWINVGYSPYMTTRWNILDIIIKKVHKKS